MGIRASEHGGFLVEGSISSGTLRSQDLLKSFKEEYERLMPFSNRKLMYEAEEMLEAFNRGEEPEHANEVVHEIADLLHEIAEKHGFYFGPTEGDGSDFGFWKEETE